MFGGAGSCSRNLRIWGASWGQEFLHTSPLPRLPPLAPLPPTCGRCTLQFSSRPRAVLVLGPLTGVVASQGWAHSRTIQRAGDSLGPWPCPGASQRPQSPRIHFSGEKEKRKGLRSRAKERAPQARGWMSRRRGGENQATPAAATPGVSLRLSAPPASPLPSQSLHSPKCKITGCCQDWTS